MNEIEYIGSDLREKYCGADVRLMSYNILSEEWNDRLPVKGRDFKCSKTILYYLPDVVALEEVSRDWYIALSSLLKDQYEFVTYSNGTGDVDYSTIMYNKKTLRTIEYGVKIFENCPSSFIRLMTWAMFEKLDTKEKFIVVCTHWDLPQNIELRTGHANEMCVFVKELYDRFKVNVFCCGDYNTTQLDKQYETFIKISGFLDTANISKVFGNMNKTYHIVGQNPESNYLESIDHIFVSPNTTCCYFSAIIDRDVIDTSDHLPIIADLAFKD